MTDRRDSRRGIGLLGLLAAVVCLAGCGELGRGRTDSETHWLVCTSDSDCAIPDTCICGLCTRYCEQDESCFELNAAALCLPTASMTTDGGTCEPESDAPWGICIRQCSVNSDCGDLEGDTRCVEDICHLYSDTSCEPGAWDHDGNPATACRPRVEGDPCAIDAHCPGDLYCLRDECHIIPAHCSNESLDTAESDVDCGGPCLPCELAAACLVDDDCGERAQCSNEHCAPSGFAYIPAGTFWMGSPDGCPGPEGYPGECDAELGGGTDERPLHEVTLTRPFYMSTMQVTQAEWLALIGTSLWQDDDCDNCPAFGLNWWSAVHYANALSVAHGLPECYDLTDCAGSLDELMNYACLAIDVNATDRNPYYCEGYRLPTEAEWEYAYRAGTTTSFYNGATPDVLVLNHCARDVELDEIAWYCGNSEYRLHEVGLKAPNAWGLFDMAGNAADWVWDYREDYTSSPIVDPLGPVEGEHRVVRSGSYGDSAEGSRAAARHGGEPRIGWDGFRLARTAVAEP